MDEDKKSKNQKLGWTFEELANSLSVSVPFLRLEVKRGRLKAPRVWGVEWFCWTNRSNDIWPRRVIGLLSPAPRRNRHEHLQTGRRLLVQIPIRRADD